MKFIEQRTSLSLINLLCHLTLGLVSSEDLRDQHTYRTHFALGHLSEFYESLS